MSSSDTVKQFMTAIAARQWVEAAAYVSDDFLFVTPEVSFSKEQYFRMQQIFSSAMGEYIHQLDDVQEYGERVTAKVKMIFIHTGELSLPLPNVSAVPALAKQVTLPAQAVAWTLRNNRIVTMNSRSDVPSGRIAGILERLDVATPIA